MSRVLAAVLFLGLVPAAQPQTTWEYLPMFYTPDKHDKRLKERCDSLGAAGWELVGMVRTSPLGVTDVLFMFKRSR